ncbi:LysR family transcriptional regulator [Cytobacillus sp. Hz8]|uniref:LysR family transcriptional regulator n=1 Tax=Cytobacillus sp. Hz8 TaxID=3347168 RepID=UPI0035DEAF1A
MNIHHLRYFVNVAKEKSFTVASHKLHVSQPALSKMIKSLESELGVLLFDRSEKTIKLTDAGDVFLSQALKILVEFDYLPRSVYNVENLNKGQIRVGIPPVIETCYFSKIIADFHRTYPHITFTLIEDGVNSVQEKLLEGLLDIAVVALPIVHDAFDVFPVVQNRSNLIVHKDHHLASKPKVNMKDLKDESFNILDDKSMLNDHILKSCKEAGFNPHIDFISSQWDLIVEMVSLNMGISILPEPIIERYNFPLIKSIPIDNMIFNEKIVLITKKGGYTSYVMKEFIRFVQKQFGGELLLEKTHLKIING